MRLFMVMLVEAKCLSRLSKYLPHNHACRHRDVQRVLRAHLWYLYGTIDNVGDGLIYALDFVAEDQGVLRATLHAEVVEHRGTLNLLYGDDAVATLAELRYALKGRRVVAPRHA